MKLEGGSAQAPTGRYFKAQGNALAYVRRHSWEVPKPQRGGILKHRATPLRMVVAIHREPKPQRGGILKHRATPLRMFGAIAERTAGWGVLK